MSRYQQSRSSKDDPRINESITVPKVRFVDEQGEMVGIIDTQEALTRAEQAGLDLVEVSPNADPPVCKALDYGKYKYEEQKKKSAARKKQKVISVKELKMRPTIDQHDLETKLNHAKVFVEKGDKVKFTVRFRGRELANTELGRELLNQIKEAFSEDEIKIEMHPRMEGRQMVMVIAPK